jgi:polyhydroxyalkanoate synthesis regulator phasin
MQTKHKLGLALLGAAATAGVAYFAYIHKDEITKKIDDLKEEILKKKNAIGTAGANKIADIVDSLIGILEKHASGKHTAEELKERDAEIEKLRAELNDLKNS